jgi:hypothetical protein
MASEHPAAFVWQGNAQLMAPIIWVGTATTSGGTWSVDYSQAGFVSAPIVQATAVLSSANVYDRAWATLSSSPTATAASGYGLRGANLAVLGATTRTVSDGTVIHVVAIGETFN